jgi:hypothetical protein
MSDQFKKNSAKLLHELLDLDQDSMARLMLKHTHFIRPSKAMHTVFPGFARSSKANYPGIGKNGVVLIGGEPIKITDNTKARSAYSRLCGFKLNGESRNIEKGWEVAHVWGQVHDPRYFTIGWNMCLMPNFLRDLTEEQNSEVFFQKLIKQVSFDLYFRDGNSLAPDFVSDQEIDLNRYLPLSEVNLLG